MKILINGIGGKMGRTVYAAIQNNPRAEAVCGVDLYTEVSGVGIPVFRTLDEVTVPFDCIIDFSVHSSVGSLLSYAIKNNKSCVLATTGYTQDELNLIENVARDIPVLLSGNMSLGVNIMTKLVKAAAEYLNGKADIEIIETHHNQKIDAPSGTAKMLYDSVKAAIPDTTDTHGRNGITGKRRQNEVAIHAVRGGTVVGKHEVSFFLNNEVLTLKHEAESKTIFANGSVEAALFLQDKKAGRLYTMNDLFK